MREIIQLRDCTPKELRFFKDTDRGVKIRTNGYDPEETGREAREMYEVIKEMQCESISTE